MRKQLTTAELIEKELLCPEHYFMRFKCPDIAKTARPGQFVNMLTPGNGVILRRPFSFTRASADKGTFDIIFRVVGPGTEWLEEQEPGVKIDILGPLGRGFNLKVAGDNPVIIGGGVGIPPLIWVFEELHERGHKPLIYLGGRVSDHLFGLEKMCEMGYDPVIATEDGSAGVEGFITVPLENEVKAEDVTQAYVCGRMEMLRALTRWGAFIGGKVQVSLECKMACGFGVCLGCAAPAREGGYMHVCTDGPVFPLDRIDLGKM
jgi:dihydroorotate dehydrogenase electron transfer subunit